MNWPIPIINPRFIPAYAGNSRKRGISLRYMAVHPRLRGELITENAIVIGCAGSSPLTRGTHTRTGDETGNGRFIPAYAGNSTRNLNVSPGRAVHPRLRGELVEQEGVPKNGAGSSPLTRGTRS